MPHTITLHRVLRTSPEKIYRAFLEAEALEKWLPPHGFTGRIHEINPVVNGGYTMSFTNFGSKQTHSFSATFLELKPFERIRYTDQFDDPNLPGTMEVTVTLKPVSVGTELHLVQQGIPDMIPAECCILGWQESLTLLGHLVEPEIPTE